MYTFSLLFEYEYILEDIQIDQYNTIFYCDITLLKDLFGFNKGDKLNKIEVQAATGIIKYQNIEYNLLV
jgi:hypothetical protein